MKKGHGLIRNELFEMITLTNRKIDTKTNLLKSENHTEMLLHHQTEKPPCCSSQKTKKLIETPKKASCMDQKTKNNLKSQ